MLSITCIEGKARGKIMFGLDPFVIYLVIINIIGFVLYLINSLLYRFTKNEQIDVIITIAAIIGGSLGIVLSILIFDRKTEKGNMMSRVFVSCILVIQIVLLMIVRGHIADNITLQFWAFFDQHKWLIAYLVTINFITFAFFAVDKIAAIEHKSRIRIVTLLMLAFFGGSLGGIIAMYLLRHKTKKDYFTVGIPLIMIMQIVLLFYAMNAAW